MSRINSKTKLRQQKSRGAGDKKQSSTVDLEGAVKKIEVPQLAWKIVSEPAMKDLKETSDIDNVARKLAAILSLTKSEECLKEAAELDYFVSGYWWAASEWQLTDEQVSAFMSLLHTVLYNLKKKDVPLSENLKELQALIASVGSVPTSLECFTSEVSTRVLQYIQTSLFQHYSLFRYLFTQEQEEETHTTQGEVELPNLEYTVFPAPLEESIPFEMYTRSQPSDSKTEATGGTQEEPAQEESEDRVPTADVAAMSSLEEEELQISSQDLRKLMEDLAKAKLEPFQTSMIQKIREKEESVSSRLSKLEKALTVKN